ncbi:MAG: ATP-binding protein [Janthinobacterium lividum]
MTTTARLLTRLVPNSILARLLALVLAGIVISHLTTTLLFITSLGDLMHPPPQQHQRQGPGAPAEPWGERPPAPAAGALHGDEIASRQFEGLRSDNARAPGEFERRGLRMPPLGFWINIVLQVLTLSLAAWYGARMLARPIQRLAMGAARLGDDLNSAPIEETGPAETRQAAQVFNRMQDRIRSQVEERSRFLAAVSHDLRTPLTRIKLRVERLPADGARDKLREDVREMAVMLDATLDYLRGEASSEASQLLDVQALVETLAENAMEEGGQVSVAGSAPALVTKPMALRRCLVNLVENALRYGSVARIVLIDTTDSLLIEIGDDGPGIPEESMLAVFEPFVRLEASRNKATGGVGLGLAIALEAAKQCGGTLKLRNASAGGLVAAVRLPRQLVAR